MRIRNIKRTENSSTALWLVATWVAFHPFSAWAANDKLAGWWERRVEVYVSQHEGDGGHIPGAVADPTVTSTPGADIEFPWFGFDSHSEKIFLEAQTNAGPYLLNWPFSWNGQSWGVYSKYCSMRVLWVYNRWAGTEPYEFFTDDHVVTITESPSKINGTVSASGTVRDLREPGAEDPWYAEMGRGAAALDSNYLDISVVSPIVNYYRTDYEEPPPVSGTATGGSPPPAPWTTVLDADGYLSSGPWLSVEIIGASMTVDVLAYDSASANAKVEVELVSGEVLGTSPAAAPDGEWKSHPAAGTITLWY